jgi:uncharacterized protein (TIGR01777 family)
MNVLVTGATGFIGSSLVRRLAGAGHGISALSRNPDAARASNLPVTAYYAWKPGAGVPAQALAGVDAVVNLAGESVNGRWTVAKKRRILESRVLATRDVVNAIAASGKPPLLINASAVGHYGYRVDEVLTEDSPAGRGFLAEVTKAWEQEAFRAGGRVVIFRLGIVLGREGGALAKILPLFRLGVGGPLGSGHQWWPWVHVADVGSAIAAALESEWHGVYNLAAPEPIRQADFAKELGCAVHRPAFLPAPAFALRMLQGEFADELLFSKRVMPSRLLAEGFRFSTATSGPHYAS